MPLLTVANRRTSAITIQDPTGLAFISFTVPGSGATTDKVVTAAQLAAIEPQLVALRDAGHLTFSIKDNPASVADGPATFPGSVSVQEDFLAAPGATLPVPHAKDLHNNATGDYMADANGGIYQLATEATSSAESAQLTWGNQLMLDPTKGLVFEAKVRLNIPGATISTDERWAVGLVSDHTNAEDSLDATTLNAWFRGEGANLNILIEGDDNTTNTDDVDTTIDYADNAWMILKIDLTDLTKVKFSINDVPVATTISLAALVATNLLQPIFVYQRDAGTEVNLLEIDWYQVYYTRD